MLKLNIVDQETIKDANKKKILNLLYKKRELTKQDIAKETGISIPTVTNNINELIEEGIVEEAGVAVSTGGRKPVVVRFLPYSRYSFGVDFSLESVRVILTDLDSEIKYDVSFETDGFKDVHKIIMHIHSIIENAMSELSIPKEKILGIGFSLPGTVNEEERVLEIAPNLGVKNIDFKQFSDILHFPLYIENEANAAAYAELTLGIAKQMRNLVYVSITHGIGAGIVIQDHLYKGKNKRAGEFGHMTVVAGGKQCKCGKNGCWELYASDRALLADYNHRTKHKITCLKDFLVLLQNHDILAQQVWDSYLDYLAIGIQNIILVLDPHYVIIGGEISQFEDMLLEPLKEKIFIKNSFYGRDDIKILLSKLKEDSSILGASLLPLQKLFFLNEKII